MANGSNLITALQPVRPGDLITATFCNGLISAIWELEKRVAVLESEGRLVIPEGGAEPVRPVILTAARAVRRRRTISFEVFGSGLEPDGLKDTFLLNNKPFQHIDLEGNDERITFRADMARLGSLGEVGEIREVFERRDAEPTGGGMRFATTVSGTAGFARRTAEAISTIGERLVEVATPETTAVLTIVAKSGARGTLRVEVAEG